MYIFSFVFIYFGFFRAFFLPGKSFSENKPEGYKRIAILVAAYKEDSIIVSTAQHHLEQDYPRDAFDIFVIADSFKPETILALQQLPIRVLEVSFEKSTKLKSLDEAFKRIKGEYDICLICDADNILAEDALQRINHYFWLGVKAVQGQRVAKNLDTPFAILDACSEAVNNQFSGKEQMRWVFPLQ